ncbi:hypothetical protein UCRPC4_g01829 [Phaeomoniella chlamydospora]|uniref:Uncharacterized protein n=1 Tax=Phaeomoniella chlamydospora TaxID=158046 RepID=A0A0G2ET80_PHACM|nr:hypothetical protein UCRPC4_g01829 [Phaeomoniella chlamydospora]
MAEGDLCVKHTLLALAAGYALYFQPSEALRTRANLHYRRAIDLLTASFADPKTQEIGNEEGVVASLLLLFIEDAVNWELRAPKEREPRWLAGARMARLILDKTDPGERYWKQSNVQSSQARISNANMVAYVDICAHPVTPLKFDEEGRTYTWLLSGTESDSRRIHGGTGLCPKLLHMFGQITHFCALAVEDPDSPILIHAAEKLQARLSGFAQWSEESEAHLSPADLFASCMPGFDGKVTTAAEVTQLTAESYVAAAQIYLHCRFFRRVCFLFDFSSKIVS